MKNNIRKLVYDFVPLASKTLCSNDVKHLSLFISSHSNVVCISGAGVSTESGLPDYRSPKGSYSRGHKPTTFQHFTESAAVRQRYWARNMQGFKFFNAAKPNESHIHLAELEKKGYIKHLVTQNVDGLHQKAGHQNVIELHGTNHQVVCLSCAKYETREAFQERLEKANIGFVGKWGGNKDIPEKESDIRADGDAAYVKEVNYSEYHVPGCTECGGVLKPDVVFFGENVPRDRVQTVFDIIEHEADSLLVLGSSLQVFSGFRFVRAAKEKHIPIAIVNIGPTRGDSLADIKIDARAGEIIPEVNTLL